MRLGTGRAGDDHHVLFALRQFAQARGADGGLKRLAHNFVLRFSNSMGVIGSNHRAKPVQRHMQGLFVLAIGNVNSFHVNHLSVWFLKRQKDGEGITLPHRLMIHQMRSFSITNRSRYSTPSGMDRRSASVA